MHSCSKSVDANGNVMGIYREEVTDLFWESSPIYGSTRIGMYKPDMLLNQGGGEEDLLEQYRGYRLYELPNHLTNFWW